MNLKEQIHKELRVPTYPYLDSANNQLIGYTSECVHCFQCGYLRALCTNPKCPTKFCLYGWYTAGLVSDQLCDWYTENPRWLSVSVDYFLNRRVMIQRMIDNNEVQAGREIPAHALSLSAINEYMFKPVNVFLLGCDESTTKDEIFVKWPWLEGGVGKPIFKIQINDNLEQFRIDFINKIPQVPSVGMVPCIVLKWKDDLPTEYEETAMKVIRDFETVQTVNIATRLIHSEQIQTNEILNLAYLNHSKWIYDLHNKFKGKPALCIAGGPSLTQNLTKIRKLQNRFVIIAVSTVAETLFKNGINPHIIATVDMKPYNKIYIDNLTEEQQKSCFLAFDLDANHEVVDSFKGDLIMIGSNLELLPVTQNMVKHVDIPCEFPKSGTVSTTVYNIAHLIGASEILLAGYDLCYTGTESHIDGVRSKSSVVVVKDETDHYLRFNDGQNVEQAISIKTYNGNAWTSKAFYAYSIELEHRIHEAQIPTYELSPDTLVKAGVKLANLDDWKSSPIIESPIDVLTNIPSKKFTNSTVKKLLKVDKGSNWEDIKYNHVAKITYLIKQYTQFNILQYGNIMNQLENLVSKRAAEIHTLVAAAIQKWRKLNEQKTT